MNIFSPQYKDSVIIVTEKTEPKGFQDNDREKYAYKLLPDLSGREKVNLGEFSGCFLEKAVIPSHIKGLDTGAFLNCAYLEYVEIPDGIINIPAGAFSGCSRLKKVRLPKSLETIGDYAFYQCKSLEQIAFPESLEKVGKQAFSGCTHLEYVVSQGNYQEGEGAFENCFSLKESKDFDDSGKSKYTYEIIKEQGYAKITKYIGNDTNVTVPEWIEGYPVRSLADRAFAECKGLISISLPNSILLWSEELFSGCSSLETISLPEVFGTKEIPKCKGLENIQAYRVCAQENEAIDFLDLTVSIAYGKNGKFAFRHELSGEVTFKNAVFSDPCVNVKKEGRVLPYRGKNMMLPRGMFKGCVKLQQIVLSSYVTAIGEEAFSGCRGLKEIILPDGMKSLPDRIFEGCEQLAKIQGIQELESIGRAAFLGCRAFDYASLPTTVREIGNNAFQGCETIRFLKIFPQVERIGEHAFEGCVNMKSLMLFPDKLQVMEKAFSGCTKLSCAKVPMDCSMMAENAFEGCGELKEIILPSNSTIIGKEHLLFRKNLDTVVFKGESVPEFQPETFEILEGTRLLLKSQLLAETEEAYKDKIAYGALVASVYTDLYSYEQIPDKEAMKILQYIGTDSHVTVPEMIEGLPVTVIGKGAFENHKEIEEISLPDSIEEIQEKTFSGCEKLRYFILPPKVTVFGKEAFWMCTGLRGITFLAPKAVYNEEEFSTCSQLKYVTVNGKTEGMDSKWEPREKFKVKIEGSHAVITDYEGMEEDAVITEYRSVFIPEIIDGYPVLQIGKEVNAQEEYTAKGVFAGCEEIEAVHFPPSVKKIGTGAFYHCTSLMSLKLPKGIRQLGRDCFRECTALVSVNMQAEEIEIGEKAFCGCRRLKAAAIWAEQIKVAQGCFDDCELLKAVFFHGSGLSGIPEEAKEGFGMRRLILMSLGEMNREIPYEYEIHEEEQTISILQYTGDEEKLNVPGYLAGLPVVEIKEEAFLNKTGLLKVGISNMVQKIGQRAFKGCSSLKQIILPEGMKRLEKETFSMCVMLEQVMLPSKLVEIGEKAFFGCRIQEMELPKQLHTIESGAFEQCLELKKVILPKELETIGTEAFSGCEKLRHIMLPSGIKTLMENTFKNCKGLKSVLFENPDCEKKQNAFLGCSLEKETSFKEIPGEIKAEFLAVIDKKCGEAMIVGISEEKEEIMIPDYLNGIPVTAIADIAFAWKKRIKRVTIPENIQVIGSMAFYSCENMEEIIFLHTKEGPRIYKEAFSAMKKAIVYLNSHESSAVFTEENCTCPLFWLEGSSYVFHRESGELCIKEEGQWTASEAEEKEQDNMQYPWNPIRDRIKKVTLEENIAYVADNAFEACTNLQEVILPDSLVRIEQAAFKHCSRLCKILLPENLESLGAEAFEGCIALIGKKDAPFLLPDSLTQIERKAFYGCSGLEYLVLPESVQKIGMWAFRKCSGLCDIYMEHEERPNQIGKEAFYETAEECEISVKFSNVSMLETKFDGNVMIHVPLEGDCGREEEGQETDCITWKLYYDGLLEIVGDGAMKDYNGTTTPWYEYSAEIQRVLIKGNVTHIGAMAFHSCSFHSIELPEGLKSIGMEAFAYCVNLAFIKIPAKVTELGTNCFRGCKNLGKVLFMTGGEECQIGISAFRDVGKECAFYISNELFRQKIKRSYASCMVKQVQDYEKKTVPSEGDDQNFVEACLYEDGFLVIGSNEKAEILKEQAWFWEREAFKEDSVQLLFLDSGICSLGKESFRKLSALKEVVVTGTMEKIEDGAFGINLPEISFYTKDEKSGRVLKYAGARKISREK
ncbi:MAG: leucine-rich repeat domain-containing protein [Lachnospiraceae bacterium]|nr:leucine-rich repeat domain-containing protein [Lachnospiraceae bacterium]